MEEDFTAILLGAVSSPVHWRVQPARQKEYPYINLSLVSSPKSYDLEGETGAQETTVQVDCWAEKYSEAVILSRQVNAALSLYSGVVGSTTFKTIENQGDRDVGGDVPVEGEDRTIFGRSGDYRVVHD